eukprot:TRINITY_DN791_c1_g1_i2.p1 TRINITY_DN791_c1_g1~~TRINITY_DN791_c1_g1_i2.p1  ORF type:complete len:136 (-),score=23.98 TRINITY_DN791_c1_g1_i2:681-1088(-)
MPKREVFERMQTDWTWEKMCRKEVRFYKELQPILQEAGVFTPQCHYAFLEDDGDCSVIASVVADSRTDTKMVLLIEDLGGYKCTSLGQYLPHKDAVVAVKMIARLHAMYWNKPLPVRLLFFKVLTIQGREERIRR